MLAQTSNDHLDELNARYQAIRHQHGELGTDTIPAPGRPYSLHPGDQVQIRRTINHPDHGPLRNGTTALIRDIDPDAQTIELALPTGQPVTLSIDQADAAQLRLAYVQHPFPAQGLTTDTAHLIVSAHATREGTYVALTRAREETHLYAEESVDSDRDGDRLQALAERISRTEPDLPSIAIPARARADDHRDTDGREPIEPDRPARQPADHDQLGVRERTSTDEAIAFDGANERDIQPTTAERDAARDTPGSTRVLPAVAIKSTPQPAMATSTWDRAGQPPARIYPRQPSDHPATGLGTVMSPKTPGERVGGEHQHTTRSCHVAYPVARSDSRPPADAIVRSVARVAVTRAGDAACRLQSLPSR